ncbi:hypothetical protein ACRAWD_06435 [Caulobacter segnis]
MVAAFYVMMLGFLGQIRHMQERRLRLSARRPLSGHGDARGRRQARAAPGLLARPVPSHSRRHRRDGQHQRARRRRNRQQLDRYAPGPLGSPRLVADPELGGRRSRLFPDAGDQAGRRGRLLDAAAMAATSNVSPTPVRTP